MSFNESAQHKIINFTLYHLDWFGIALSRYFLHWN